MSKQNTCGDYADPAKEYQKMCAGSYSKKKKVGGTMEYPFEPKYNTYPIPNKVDFKVDNATNMISSVDMFGCKGTLDANIFVPPKQTGGKSRSEQPLAAKQKFSGGDCGCATTSLKLGGSLKKQQKQKAAGYGYTMNCEQPITNRCEVDRYPTDSALAGGSLSKNQYLLEISRQKKQHKQKGGSAASDSLMEYFLDFQHRCRGSEIY
jgi:hypothetical protein